MVKRILLPLDGSQNAEQALPHAVAQADHFIAELILCKVLKPIAKNINLPLGALWRAEEATRQISMIDIYKGD
jgi:nucleotide-binding universal stress UspA family protein